MNVTKTGKTATASSSSLQTRCPLQFTSRRKINAFGPRSSVVPSAGEREPQERLDAMVSFAPMIMQWLVSPCHQQAQWRGSA